MPHYLECGKQSRHREQSKTFSMKSVLEAQHGRRVRAADLPRRQCAHSLRTGASAESLASLGFLEPNHRDIQECLAVVELDSKPKKIRTICIKEVRYYKVGSLEFIPQVASTIFMHLLPTK